jgi:hypothetical protein
MPRSSFILYPLFNPKSPGEWAENPEEAVDVAITLFDSAKRRG